MGATFMSKVDHYSSKIMSLVSTRGGATKMDFQRIKTMVEEDHSIERKREAAIHSLVVYLNEKEEDLFKELVDEYADITREVLKIAISRGTTPVHAGVVIEETEVLGDLDVPRACALLMGLIYKVYKV